MAGVANGIARRGRHRVALAVPKNAQAPGVRRRRGRVHRPKTACGWRQLIGRPVDDNTAGLARAEHRLAGQHRFELIGDNQIHGRRRWGRGVDQHRGAPLGGVASRIAGRGGHCIALAVLKNPQTAGDHRRSGRVHRPETACGWYRLVSRSVDGHADHFAD